MDEDPASCNVGCLEKRSNQPKYKEQKYKKSKDYYKADVKQRISKPTTVSEHFLSHSNHSHTDMQLIPLEKIHFSRDSVRKARESHLSD